MSHARLKHREYPWEPVATSGNHSDHSVAWMKMLSKAKSWSQRPQKTRIKQVGIGSLVSRSSEGLLDISSSIFITFELEWKVNLTRRPLSYEGSLQRQHWSLKTTGEDSISLISVLIYYWRKRTAPLIKMKQQYHCLLKHPWKVNCLVNCPLGNAWCTRYLHMSKKPGKLRQTLPCCYPLSLQPGS